MSPGLLQLAAVRSDRQTHAASRLQSVQNAAARLITGSKRREHITPLRQLHWLPVRRRVEFKTASLVYQVLSSKVPGYLADDIHLASESARCSLRSSSGRKCSVTRVVLVTDVLLQLDHVSGTTYLPVCETRKSAQLHRIHKTTENIHVSDGLRRIVTFLIIAPYKYSYLLTYLDRNLCSSLSTWS